MEYHQIVPVRVPPLTQADTTDEAGTLNFEFTPAAGVMVSLDGLLEFELGATVTPALTVGGETVRFIPFVASACGLQVDLDMFGETFTSQANVYETSQAMTRTLAKDDNTVNALYGLEQYRGLDSSFEGYNLFSSATLGAISGNSNVNPRTQLQFSAGGGTPLEEVCIKVYHPLSLGVAKVGFVPPTPIRYNVTYFTPPAEDIIAVRAGLPSSAVQIINPIEFFLNLWLAVPDQRPQFLNPFNTSKTTLNVFYPHYRTEVRTYRFQENTSFVLQFQKRQDTAQLIVSQRRASSLTDNRLIQGIHFGGPRLAMLQVEIYDQILQNIPTNAFDVAKRFMYSHYMHTMAGKETNENFQNFSMQPFDVFMTMPLRGQPSGTFQVNFTTLRTDTSGNALDAGELIRMFVTTGVVASWTLAYEAGQFVSSQNFQI